MQWNNLMNTEGLWLPVAAKDRATLADQNRPGRRESMAMRVSPFPQS